MNDILRLLLIFVIAIADGFFLTKTVKLGTENNMPLYVIGLFVSGNLLLFAYVVRIV